MLLSFLNQAPALSFFAFFAFFACFTCFTLFECLRLYCFGQGPLKIKTFIGTFIGTFISPFDEGATGSFGPGPRFLYGFLSSLFFSLLFFLLLGFLITPEAHADLLPDLSLRPADASSSNPFSTIQESASPSLGGIMTWQTSPYKNAKPSADLIPVYGYDSEVLYLDAARIGLQFKAIGPPLFGESTSQRFQLFLAHQFEGFPLASPLPPALSTLSLRHSGTDVGVAWRVSSHEDQTALALQARQDVSQTSHGGAVQASLQHHRPWGPLLLTPELDLSWRSAALNRYYYGISAQEATTARPAYLPGAGINAGLGLQAQMGLSDRWQLMGGVAATAFSKTLANSPIVQKHGMASFYLGMAYDFEPHRASHQTAPTDAVGDTSFWNALKPDSLKLSSGASTANGCSLVGIVSLQCLNVNHKVFTSLVGIQGGKRVIQDWHDWPLDVFVEVGLDRHLEHGQQTDATQVEGAVKFFYHRFPWDALFHTRLGLGIGVSDSSRPLFAEWNPKDTQVSQAPRSHLMNYMEPTVDVSLGDLFKVDDWRQTYLGFGVSHRSGIFSNARLLGKVDGGSNFMVIYLERVLN